MKNLKDLIKPTLTYLGVCMLTASFTLYLVDNPPETSKEVGIELASKDFLKIDNLGLNQVSHYKAKTDVDTSLLNTKAKAKVNLKEFYCLKLIGWHEIRGGTERAIKNVYSVVENRKNSGLYPVSYCSIMKQSYQFSFWNKGKYNVKALEPKPTNPLEQVALNNIEKVSYKILQGTFNPTLSPDVLWYSTSAAKRNKGLHWTNQYNVAVNDNYHLFYVKP